MTVSLVDQMPRRDELPFRALEAAHRRVGLAEHELTRARREQREAFERMREAGYVVQRVEDAGEFPLPPL